MSGPSKVIKKPAQNSIDAEAYEHAAVVYALLYALLLLILWVSKVSTYLTSPTPDPAVSAISSFMSGSKLLIFAPISIFVLLIVSNLRVVLGSLLCHSKSSELRAAIVRRVETSEECLLKFTFMYVLIKSIAFIALVRSYAFGSPSALVLPGFLLAEALVIIYFDHKFRDEIEEVDKERWIVRNDWLFLIAAALWFAIAIAAYIPAAVPDFIRPLADWTRTNHPAVWSKVALIPDVAGESLFILFVGVSFFHTYAFWKEAKHYKSSVLESVHTSTQVARKFVLGR